MSLPGRDADIFAVISFYSSTIFEEVGYTATEALYASLGYGAVQVIFTIPTLFLIDTKGRRTLTLIVRLHNLYASWFAFLVLTPSADVPAHVYLPIGSRSVSVEYRRLPGRTDRTRRLVSITHLTECFD